MNNQDLDICTCKFRNMSPAFYPVTEDEVHELLILFDTPCASLQPNLVTTRSPSHRTCSGQESYKNTPLQWSLIIEEINAGP